MSSNTVGGCKGIMDVMEMDGPWARYVWPCLVSFKTVLFSFQTAIRSSSTHTRFQRPHSATFRSPVTLLVTHWLFLRHAVLKIQWQDIKLPSRNSSGGHEIGMHIKENFPMPLEAVKSLFHVAARGERQFLGRAHTKRTKKDSVIMGHLWLHTFHLPLCVTVINILLTQNTRPRWFTGANYTMYRTSVSLPAGQTVPVPFSPSLSHIFPHNLFPLLLTNSQTYFFCCFPSSWVSSFS